MTRAIPSTPERPAQRVAVLIPCYNEELTVGHVVRDFRQELPEATIYVVDNNSTDRTAEEARAAGALVRRECRQGKGYVVQSMLQDIDADLYVMVDGDGTYTASDVHRLIEPVAGGEADTAVAVRLEQFGPEAFRPLHLFGNRIITAAINSVFRSRLRDVLSGYRVFNRRFARSVPVTAGGFDVETELTLQGLRHGFVFTEVRSAYKDRPEGSTSKLSTFRDGFRIALRILSIYVVYKPLRIFGIAAALFLLLSLLSGAVVVYEYLKYSYIYRVPTAIFAAGSMLMAGICLVLGIVLDVVNTRIRGIEYLLSLKK